MNEEKESIIRFIYFSLDITYSFCCMNIIRFSNIYIKMAE